MENKTQLNKPVLIINVKSEIKFNLVKINSEYPYFFLQMGSVYAFKHKKMTIFFKINRSSSVEGERLI